MDAYRTIAHHFQTTLESLANSVDDTADSLARAAARITESLLEDRRVFVCGAGPDRGIALLLADCLMHCTGDERPPFPAMALTSRECEQETSGGLWAELKALTQTGDVVVCVDTSDSGDFARRALELCRPRSQPLVILSHANNAVLASGGADGATCVLPQMHPRRLLLEFHASAATCISRLIEQQLFGD